MGGVTLCLRLGLHVGQGVDVEGFDFFAGPGGAAEEDEAGFDAGLPVEAVDGDHASEHLPAVVFNELCDHHLERDAMKWVFGTGGVHEEFVRGEFILRALRLISRL